MKGIGVDILSMERFRRIMDSDNGSFRSKVFTANEQELLESMPRSLFHYATRFAGKEAVFKAVSPSCEIRLNEIEILCDENGAPTVMLTGSIADAAQKKGISTVLVSLSYEEDYAVAFASAL